MRTDYIIVGCGLAGLAFAQTLRLNGRSFVVVDSSEAKASLVAGGLYNPVMLKRFTMAWKADEQIDLALPFYRRLEKELKIKFDHILPVKRLIHSAEEQNNWFAALDKPKVGSFLSSQLTTPDSENFKSPFGLGEVLDSGRIDTKSLITGFTALLEKNGQLIDEHFDYNVLELNPDSVSYKNLVAKRLVFCEGSGLLNNPFLKYLPLRGNKGELLRIKAPDLKLEFILKSSMFFIPLGNDEYLVGATYNRQFNSEKPSKAAREEIEKHIRKIIGLNYDILEQTSGIRPTVKDRRPLVGIHPEFSSIAVLNGLGSRGVLIAPYLAHILYDHLENNTTLPDEIDIARFSQDLDFTEE